MLFMTGVTTNKHLFAQMFFHLFAPRLYLTHFHFFFLFPSSPKNEQAEHNI